MQEKKVKQTIGKVFMDIASGLETGSFGKKVRIGLTTLGSEHGVENMIKGAELAAEQSDFDIVLIGPKVDTELEIVEVNDESDMHTKMELLIDSGEIDACVTMHYNFDIGTSTVGRVQTPAIGKQMYLATTTGTSSAHRVEGMVKNALYGIITAKAMGNPAPTIGILNVDGARQTERVLKQLQEKGYEINFAESMRADGGSVMRGNDLLAGTCDVMVTDTLTGNVLTKVFSSFLTGGDYEAVGDGYGPGICADMKRTILILSRASGAPVVANALSYAAKLAKGKVSSVAKNEFEKAKKAGLDSLLQKLVTDTAKTKSETVEVKAPPKEVVTGQISGVDILDLEEAVVALWAQDIYAESGMGCTGPIVMVNETNVEKATDILKKEEYIA